MILSPILSSSFKIKQSFFLINYRQPGQRDPPYEPSKVLMIERIHTLKHRPYWEKKICADLGLSIDVKVKFIKLFVTLFPDKSHFI